MTFSDIFRKHDLGKGMFMAKISVIIPCYNVSAYIDRCLTSITTQTIGIHLLEIICIDDASCDNTWQKLQQWELQYPDQIIIIHNDSNCRQGTARNIGLNYASGDWISFIDSDDWIEPDYFEKLYTIANKTSSDIVTCQAVRDSSLNLTFLDNKKTIKEDRYMIINTLEKRKLFITLKCMDCVAWGKLIRKSLLLDHQIFFPENLTYEDTYWGSLLHIYAEKVYFLEETLYHYFVNESSTVLQIDSEHHIDLLTVQMILWNEWEKRGLFEFLKEELEYDFLYSCYLRFLKIIVFRYQQPSFSLFTLLQTLIRQRIPDYSNNYYIKEIKQSDLFEILFQSILLPMNKESFGEFTTYIKNIGM